ncbi:MAG TPA: hypothetical protein VGK87_14850 [Anaerolineae bacterium]|jgi:hypothetical protein
MFQESSRVSVKPLNLVIAIVGFLAVIIYGSIALAAQDWLWFVPGFSERPVKIVVYNAGKSTVFTPGVAGFNVLSEAVVQSLNKGAYRQSGIGLSEGSMQDAYNVYKSVEVYFSRPVKLHAPFNTFEPMVMLFPITGRHSEVPTVFFGSGGVYISNSPVLNTIEPIRAALNSLGL